MTMLLAYPYTSQEIARYCESRAATIRQARQTVTHGLFTIGEALDDVKAVLPHGEFGKWLEAYFDMSIATANNYMNLYRAIESDARFWDYPPTVLYMLTSGIPESGRVKLLERGPCSEDDARPILWESTIEAEIEPDNSEIMGTILHRIEAARQDTTLKDVAAAVFEKYEDIFARLSSREPAEIRREILGTFRERYENEPRPGRAEYAISEGQSNCTLGVWMDSVFYPLAHFPKQDDPRLESLRRNALGAIAQALDIKREV